MADSPQDAPRQAVQVVRRVLLRRNIAVDVETAQVVVAAVQAALQPSTTHESIDALPRSRTRDYVRGLLVEHGVLPRRDETKVRYQEWAQDALERLTDEANRAIIDPLHPLAPPAEDERTRGGVPRHLPPQQADRHRRDQLPQLAPRPRDPA